MCGVGDIEYGHSGIARCEVSVVSRHADSQRCPLVGISADQGGIVRVGDVDYLQTGIARGNVSVLAAHKDVPGESGDRITAYSGRIIWISNVKQFDSREIIGYVRDIAINSNAEGAIGQSIADEVFQREALRGCLPGIISRQIATVIKTIYEILAARPFIDPPG